MRLIRPEQPINQGVQETSNTLADDRFTDPVGYLAAFGIEAELVSEEVPLPEAA